MHILARRLLTDWQTWLMIAFVAAIVYGFGAVINRSASHRDIERKLDRVIELLEVRK